MTPVLDYRQTAAERFAALGLPTTKNEEWRFTNVAPIARTQFVPAGDVAIDAALIPDFARDRIVLINGRYSAKYSTRRIAAEIVDDHVARYAAFDEQPFVAWNTASAEQVAAVRIPRGAIAGEPVYIIHVAAADGEAAVAHPRVLILVEEAAQATFVETYLGANSGLTLANAVTEIVVGPGAVVDHYKLQIENERSYHVATMQVVQGRGSNFSSHSISLGGALVRNDVNTVLAEGAEATINGLYVVSAKQHIDNHTAIDHAKPNANSHELYKGILGGQATAVFNGKIFVRKDAQKTDAKQTNKNLVLSEDAVIDTKPELQIFADDVRCTHGATIGQLDEEMVFYLRSRGVGADDARRMLTFAFARDIVDRVKVEPLREHLERLLLEKLDGIVR